jgi:hypothetical protein
VIDLSSEKWAAHAIMYLTISSNLTDGVAWLHGEVNGERHAKERHNAQEEWANMDSATPMLLG